jgi:hypothetical protein
MGILPLGWDRVEIRRVRRVRKGAAPPAALGEQPVEDEQGPFGAFELEDGVEGLDPLAGLVGSGSTSMAVF